MEISGKSPHLLNIFDASQNYILKTSHITNTLEISDWLMHLHILFKARIHFSEHSNAVRLVVTVEN